MSFLGFSTLSLGQHAPDASPQRIGGQYQDHQQQQRKQPAEGSSTNQQQPASADDEVQQLAQEYREEADRLAEQLSLCGIEKQHLSLQAVNDLELLAQLACVLDVMQPTPRLILAAWSMLLVKHSKATMLQRKVERELAAIRQKRAKVQQKLAVLQKLAADVQARQQKDAQRAAQQLKMARQVQEKAAGYKAQGEQLEAKLEASGFRPELTHSALLAKAEQLEALRRRLADLHQQLDKYHQLPASLLGARMKLEEAKRQLEEKQKRFAQYTV